MMTDIAPQDIAGALASYIPAIGGAVAGGTRFGVPLRSNGANRRLEPTAAA